MMKTKAVRLYGKRDLRLEEFDLPTIRDGEILIKIAADSICMSTYKTALQGEDHVRVPDNVAENPVIVGHEFCAEIVEVGNRWKNDYQIGEKVIIPPVLSYLGTMDTIGYSFTHIGGDATYALVYEHIIEHGHLIKISSDAFFRGCLVEPVSCVIRGFKATYHLDHTGTPITGIKNGGNVAILAGCGPMGLAAIDCALHGDRKPALVLVTDVDQARLDRAKQIFDPAEAKKQGIRLVFSTDSQPEVLRDLTGGYGYDDVFVFAPVPSVVELADSILAFDGCLNFFAGPMDKAFSANLNFYNVHYAQHHIAGTSGSTTEDMLDVVRLISEQRIDPAVMITHVGGIDAVIDTTLKLPQIPGGKKLIYTHIDMPLTAVAEFVQLGKTDPRFAQLAQIIADNNGLWCAQAERYLLSQF